MEAHPIEQHEIDKIVDDGDEEEDFDDEFVSEEELDKLMEEVSNESSILTDIENVSSSSFGTSILTPLDPIHSDPVSVTGMCLALYSESDSGKFFNPSYDFKPIPDQQCDEYMLMRPTEELEGYEKYAAECYKYNIPKISAIKDCLNGNPVLDLSNYSPGGIGMQLLFDVLCGPPIINLTDIDLENSPFSEAACISLTEFLLQTMTLKNLNMSNCQIGAAAAEILAEGFQGNQSLEYLNLSRCNLRDAGGAAIANALIYNSYLKEIDLSHNLLSSQTGAVLGLMLAQNETLTVLELGWNNLYPEKECNAKILNGMAKNKAIVKLGLSWNGLTGPLFAKSLRKAIRKCKTLEILDLEYNRIIADDCKPIATALRRSKSIREVYLGGNPLMPDDQTLFISILKSKTPIEILSLGDYTFITQETNQILKPILATKPELQVIYRGVLMSNPPEPVDFKPILINRAKFLAMKPKKKKLKRNMGHFFLKQLEDPDSRYITKEEFAQRIKDFKAKLDDDLVRVMGDEFTVTIGTTKKSRKKRVDIHLMAETYLKMHPTEPPPPPPPKKKKGKGKGKKGEKGKKKK